MPWPFWSQSTSQAASSTAEAVTPASAASASSASSSSRANDPRLPSPSVPQTGKISKPLPVEEPYDDTLYANDLREIGIKSLQTGAVAGALGALVGGGAGIMRSAPPVLFAAFAGFQWFSLGASYRASKCIISHAWGGEERLSNADHVKASGVGGAVAGMVGGLIRGPRNIIPGIVVFGSLASASTYASQNFQRSAPKPKTSIFDHKWSPLTKLTDEQYIEKLEEKILRINAEIAIIDDTLAPLKKSVAENTKSSETTDGERK